MSVFQQYIEKKIEITLITLNSGFPIFMVLHVE